MRNDPDKTTRTDPDNPDNPDIGERPGPGQSGHTPIGVSGMSGGVGCPAVRPRFVVRRLVGGFYLGPRGWTWTRRDALTYPTATAAEEAAAPFGRIAYVDAQ